MHKTIKIKQTMSMIGRSKKHKSTILGLGLKRINHVIERENTPAIRGMIKKVFYMIKIEE